MEKAIEAALDVFWRQGYDGTSVDDLLAATGLHKGSLYKAFGDKRSLYIASLERYMSYLQDGWKMTRTSAASPKAALRRWFQVLVANQGGFKGCFVANTSTELAPRDPEIAAMLRNFTATFRAGFAEAIERGKELGEFPPDVDPHLASELLAIVMFGLRIVGKHSPHTPGLEDAIVSLLE